MTEKRHSENGVPLFYNVASEATTFPEKYVII